MNNMLPSPAPSEHSGRDRRSKSDKELGLRAPKGPDKPLVPYMRYSRTVWNQVRAENPDRPLWDIGRIIGQMWRDLPDGDKFVFQQEYDREKAIYDREMKSYHGSREYQDYLMAKNAATARTRPGAGMTPQQAMPPPQPMRHHPYGPPTGGIMQQRPVMAMAPQADTGVVIQPVDENDDGDSQLNLRRYSQVRYNRNQRLVYELFSETAVTDLRSVVTQSRMDMLRKQAESLQRHQSKLEQELTSLEQRFTDKKKNIEDASAAFSAQLKEVCDQKPSLDDAKYEEMVKKASEKLLSSYERFKNGTNTPTPPPPNLDSPAATNDDPKQQQQQLVNGYANQNGTSPSEAEPNKTTNKKSSKQAMSNGKDPVQNIQLVNGGN